MLYLSDLQPGDVLEHSDGSIYIFEYWDEDKYAKVSVILETQEIYRKNRKPGLFTLNKTHLGVCKVIAHV